MTVRVEIDHSVAVVTLDRSAMKNAISQDMRARLWEAFEGFALNPDVRAAVLTGAGGDFCSGMDVSTMGKDNVSGSIGRMTTLQRIARSIYHLKVPVIAAISGVCVGAGWSLALSADLAIVSDTVRFSQIFRNIGLCPDAGSVWHLQQLVGPMRAKEIVYSGRMIRADEAVALGLALEKTSSEDLLPRAMELARTLAQGPTIAYGLGKRQFEMAAHNSFDAFLDSEFLMQPIAHRTDDYQEGLKAFRERRPPNFEGA